jgi:hypothetical protein
VTRKLDHRGEREISRKTIARGMPGVSGVTVVTCLRAFYFCTQGCGRIERPAFPAPFLKGRAAPSEFEGEIFLINSREMRGEIAPVCPVESSQTTR